MQMAAFFTREGRARVEAAVKTIEGKTAAEIVVTVHPAATTYRHTDLGVGVACATIALLVFLFSPVVFDTEAFPFEFLAVLFAGTFACEHLPPLRRLLTSKRAMNEAVHNAARAAFVDLGVTRTTGRTGILVFVSAFERRVEVVTDIGVDRAALGEKLTTIERALERALTQAAPFSPFILALESLAPPLAEVLPVSADDVDELPDGLQEQEVAA